MKKYNKILASAIILFQIVNCSLYIDNCNAQWLRTNGPGGGSFYCFAASGNNIFSGCSYLHEGVIMSTNNGTSWTAANNGISDQSVLSLAISGNRIFAGTDGSGVFISTNNGNNWASIGLLGSDIYSLVVSANTIFAGTDSGVYNSTDYGENWNYSGLIFSFSFVSCDTRK